MNFIPIALHHALFGIAPLFLHVSPSQTPDSFTPLSYNTPTNGKRTTPTSNTSTASASDTSTASAKGNTPPSSDLDPSTSIRIAFGATATEAAHAVIHPILSATQHAHQKNIQAIKEKRNASTSISNSSKKKKKRAITMPIRNEIQLAISMVAMATVMTKDSMKVKQQETMARKLYHGDKNGM